MTTDQIVVSVGPYKFVTRRPTPRRASESPLVSTSPPTSICETRKLFHPLVTSACQSVGVPCRIVDQSSRSPAQAPGYP